MILDIINDINLNFGPASYASLIQSVLGIVASKLKIFDIDKSTYRKQITEITEKSVERLSVLLSDILYRKVETSIQIRGESNHEDIVAKFHKLIFTETRIFIELESDFLTFKALNKCLFYNAIIGVFLFVVVTVWEVDKAIFLSIILLLLVLEIICIFIMRIKVEKLDKYI